MLDLSFCTPYQLNSFLFFLLDLEIFHLLSGPPLQTDCQARGSLIHLCVFIIFIYFAAIKYLLTLFQFYKATAIYTPIHAKAGEGAGIHLQVGLRCLR